jgi:hypothetical protein
MENTRLNRLLLSLLGKEEFVKTWWDSSNLAFNMKTPKQMFAEEPETVVNYILGQFNGDYL